MIPQRIFCILLFVLGSFLTAASTLFDKEAAATPTLNGNDTPVVAPSHHRVLGKVTAYPTFGPPNKYYKGKGKGKGKGKSKGSKGKGSSSLMSCKGKGFGMMSCMMGTMTSKGGMMNSYKGKGKGSSSFSSSMMSAKGYKGKGMAKGATKGITSMAKGKGE